jgi:hypothetical protein
MPMIPPLIMAAVPKGYTDYLSLAQERGEQPKACVDDRWR